MNKHSRPLVDEDRSLERDPRTKALISRDLHTYHSVVNRKRRIKEIEMDLADLKTKVKRLEDLVLVAR